MLVQNVSRNFVMTYFSIFVYKTSINQNDGFVRNKKKERNQEQNKKKIQNFILNQCHEHFLSQHV